MKSSASKCRGQSDAEDVVGAPKRDAVRVGSVQYSGVSDSDNLVSDLIECSSLIFVNVFA